MAEAAKAQRALRYTEPPWYPRPISVTLGNLSLKNGKANEAEAAFKIALEEVPAWTKAERGLKLAQKQNSGSTNVTVAF